MIVDTPAIVLWVLDDGSREELKHSYDSLTLPMPRVTLTSTHRLTRGIS